MKKASFIAVVGNKWMTSFMRKADLFEDFKVIGSVSRIQLEYTNEVDLTYEKAAESIKHIIASIEEAKQIPIFVHLVGIESDDVIMLNRQLKVPYFRDEKIKAVSDGDKWFILDHLIKVLIQEG